MVAGFLSALAIPDAADAAASGQLPGNPSAQVYVHPEKMFSIAVPAGSEIVEREAPVDISVRSREGWLMHVQSAPRNDAETIPMMVAKLESRYVGPDRPWNVKLGHTQRLVAGLPAYEGLYEGSGSKARVVIVRTKSLDMVLMFIAPERSYVKVEAVFDAILASFSPPTNGGDGGTFSIENVSPEAPATDGAFRTFQDGPMGIAVGYPGDWRVDQPTPHMVVFSGRSGHGAMANASIQNVAGASMGDPRAAAGAVLQEIMAQLAYSVSDVRHSPIESMSLRGEGGDAVEARHLLSEFTRVGTPFRQWSIALPRGNGATVHVFTFVAPAEAFEAMRLTVEAMVQSWTLTPVAR